MGEICSRIDDEHRFETPPKSYPSIDISTRNTSELSKSSPSVYTHASATPPSASKKKHLRMRNAVMMAAYRKQLQQIARYISDGFPVNYPLTQTGWRLVHVAAQTGDDKLLTLLMDLEADLTLAEAEEGLTAYEVAVKFHKTEIVKMLSKPDA